MPQHFFDNAVLLIASGGFISFVVGIIGIILIRKLKEEMQRRKRAEVKLLMRTDELEVEKNSAEQGRNELSAVLSSMGDGLIVTNHDGQVMYVSQTAGVLLRVAPADVIGKKVGDYFCCFSEGAEVCTQDDLIHQTVLKMDIVNIYTDDKIYCRKKDGSSFPISMAITPLILKNNPAGVIVVFRDASKEREMMRTKDEFMLNMSHQLRTPLSTVKWYIEMLLGGDAGKTSKIQKEYLQEIEIGYSRMVKVVDILLMVSDIELGKLQYIPQMINVTDLINDILQHVKIQLKKKKVSLKSEIKLLNKNLAVDRELFSFCLRALIDNAIKYSKENGTIKVKFGVEDNSLLVEVADDGLGIPLYEQNRVFSKLFRANNILQKDTDGNGLSLFVLKNAIDKARGKVWFESKEGKGTSFFISIPIIFESVK